MLRMPGSTQQNGTAERHDGSASSPASPSKKSSGHRVCDAAICRSRQQLRQQSIHLAQQSWGHTILDLWIVHQHYRYHLGRKSGEKTHLQCKKLVNDGEITKLNWLAGFLPSTVSAWTLKKGLLCVILQHHSSQKNPDSRHTPIAIQRHRPPDAKTTKSFSSGAAGASLSSSNKTVLRCSWYLVTGLQTQYK